MKKNQAIDYLRKKLVADRVIYIRESSLVLKVTERTVRRYIDQLCHQGIASKFYGGAKIKNLNIEKNVNELLNQKRGIDFPSYVKTEHENHKTLSNLIYIFGSFNLDIVTEVMHFPAVGETIKAISTEFFPGGKGANQAIAASQFNDNIHLFIKVGNDAPGDIAERYLQGSRINKTTIIRDTELKTGSALVMIEMEQGNSNIVIDPGANENIDMHEILSEQINIMQAKVFLTQLENNIQATKLALEIASAYRCYIILNPAPYSEDILSHLHLVDLLTPNEKEAELLSGIKINTNDDADIALKKIHSMGVNEIIMTQGQQGAIYYNGVVMKRFRAISAAVIDTSGAGDAFNGALAAKIAEGSSMDNAIRYAVAYASLAVEKKGASTMPAKEGVSDRLLKGKYRE